MRLYLQLLFLKAMEVVWEDEMVWAECTKMIAVSEKGRKRERRAELSVDSRRIRFLFATRQMQDLLQE